MRLIAVKRKSTGRPSVKDQANFNAQSKINQSTLNVYPIGPNMF
jgi:hypothetical protein